VGCTHKVSLAAVCKQCMKFYYSVEVERDSRVKRSEEVEKDEVGERLHFRENSKSTGYIIYTVSWIVRVESLLMVIDFE